MRRRPVKSRLKGPLRAQIVKGVPGTIEDHVGRVIKDAEIEMGVAQAMDFHENCEDQSKKDNEPEADAHRSVCFRGHFTCISATAGCRDLFAQFCVVELR